MKIVETELPGAFVLQQERRHDDRGYFARTFCRDELAARGLVTEIAQCNVSANTHAHTLRGLHYQRPPHAETKLVRCTRGAIWDVIVDLRPDSPTLHRWFGHILDAERGDGLYIPAGCAHGYLTLVAGAEIFYQVDQPYAPSAEAGLRWDDPALAIEWPHAPVILSDRDRGFELLR